MSIFLIFCAGLLFLACVLFIKPRAKMKTKWQTALVWLGFTAWFLITCMGLSFIYINFGVGHVKATSTAVFLFGGISIVLAIILARALGLFGVKATNLKEIPLSTRKE